MKFILFADDTTLYYSSKNVNSIRVLDKELKKVKSWLDCNKLSLNIDKSCYLRFSLLPEANIAAPKIQNNPLTRRNVTKYLGILIDDKLTWKDHIHHVNMKLRKGIGLLSKVSNLVTKATLKTLYYSFIYPYLNYNLLNWCSAAPTNLNCLKISNKKAVRTILSKNNREPSLPLFKLLEILPFEELINFKQGQFMWKVDHSMMPSLNQSCYVQNNFEIYTRQNVLKFIIPTPRTTYAKRHLTYTTIKLWNNSIPNHIKQSNSLPFKKAYKKLLFGV